MSDKAEALSAIDEMTGAVKLARPGDIRIDRDTFLGLLKAFRAWVADSPEPAKPKPHVPYRRPA